MSYVNLIRRIPGFQRFGSKTEHFLIWGVIALALILGSGCATTPMIDGVPYRGLSTESKEVLESRVHICTFVRVLEVPGNGEFLKLCVGPLDNPSGGSPDCKIIRVVDYWVLVDFFYAKRKGGLQMWGDQRTYRSADRHCMWDRGMYEIYRLIDHAWKWKNDG